MIPTKGYIPHEGCTNNITHYTGVFSSYNKKLSVVIEGRVKTIAKVRTSLISLGTICSFIDTTADDTMNEDEAT